MAKIGVKFDIDSLYCLHNSLYMGKNLKVRKLGSFGVLSTNNFSNASLSALNLKKHFETWNEVL